MIKHTMRWLFVALVAAGLSGQASAAAVVLNGPLVTAGPIPAFSDLSGSASCNQLPAFVTGDTTSSAGSCVLSTGKVNGVTYPSGPSTNTVPVVTGSNLITYETVPNAALANPATTVNGQTCTLGSTCTITASAGTITVGTTTVATGTSGDILYNNAGILGNLGVTGTAGSVVLSVSPALTSTPTAPTASVGTNTTQLATTAFTLANAPAATTAVAHEYVTAYASLGSGLTLAQPNFADLTQTVAAKTTAYSVLSTDNATWFTNTGAGGSVVLTLPASPATNQVVCGIVTAAQILEFLAPASTKIAIGTTNSAAAGNIQSNAPFSKVCLWAETSTQWVALDMLGTETVN